MPGVDPAEIEAWTAAAADLGIVVELRDDAVVVRDFGTAAGMLCAIRRSADGIRALQRDAAAAGMGWSALGPSFVAYDRELFVDALSDWGWSGTGPPPAWYAGDPAA
jgi:hypothetical protein